MEEQFYQYESDSSDDEGNEEQRRQRRKQKRKQIKEEEMMIGLAVNCAKVLFERYRNEEDPVLRHSLFIDKFQLLSDMLYGVSKTFLKRYDPELQREITNLVKDIRKDFSQLSEWIKAP
jgi:hypothetical protein